jgi:RNA polymerase sigma factor (TIGR02999 family)
MRATSLAHEAWLRLAHRAPGTYAGEDQALAVSACAMRSVLVDHARRQATAKRGGGQERHDVTAMEAVAYECALPPSELLALDAALRQLETLDPRKSRVVELRFFGGLSVEETAAELGISAPTVKRDWRLARAWLNRELS